MLFFLTCEYMVASKVYSTENEFIISKGTLITIADL